MSSSKSEIAETHAETNIVEKEDRRNENHRNKDDRYKDIRNKDHRNFSMIFISYLCSRNHYLRSLMEYKPHTKSIY